MPTRNELTSSQSEREQELQNFSLIFEPVSDENLYNFQVYSAPLGQYFSPEIVINSGSFYSDSISGSITIKKEVHLFDSELEATKFITQVGQENVSVISTKTVGGQVWHEIHLINFPKLKFSFEMLDLEPRSGYRLEVYKSSSSGLEPVNRELVLSVSGSRRTLSDTYLKYFDFEKIDG